MLATCGGFAVSKQTPAVAVPYAGAQQRHKVSWNRVSAPHIKTRELMQQPQQRMQPPAPSAALAGHNSHHDPEHSNKTFTEYMRLARIHNMIPSILLVVVGAWAGAGHRLAAVQSMGVWVMGLISGSIAVASVVVNDYFDLKIDATNAPDKPLPSGAIAPDTAILLSCLLYCGCLIAACLMEPSRLRSIVAFSAAATLLYTPLFKRLTAIKNATVAMVIALAPIAGALAAGAGDAGLLRLLPATFFAFSGVMFREILMDLNDAEGDRAAGVWTLPVLLGKPCALVCALGCLLLGSCASWVKLMPAISSSSAALSDSSGDFARWLLSSSVWPWLEAGLSHLGLGAGGWGSCTSVAEMAGWLVVAMPVAVLLAATGKLVRLAVGAWRSGFDPEVVGQAVDECLKPIGWGIILLAAMG